ncbi:hypothetical protein CsSME_00009491 [Camellia sinensis var. sinensis]
MVISCKSINLVSEISCGKGEDCSDESPCNVNMMSAMTSFDPESSDIIVHEGTYQDEPQIVYVKKGLCHRCLKGSCFTEKVVCIVCGARYCSNCVLRAMGSMPEGRKCITCVSSPVHESRRGTLGKCSWGLKQLLTDLNVKQIMRAEISCEANQLPSEVVYVNGKPLCHEELVRLQTCPNPPKKLKPGMYWYDKISGFWGKEGQKPCQIISAQLEVGDSIKRNASNGNTNILINNREITKAELRMLQWAGILCEGNLHLWLSKDGSYQEEGQNNVTGRTKLWDKTGTKLVCALLSLPIPPEHANSSGKEVVNLGNGVVPNYLAQKTLNKFLLVGYDKSGTSTIFKQARMVYNVCFSEDERQNIKPMIQSSLYGYLVILLEARERFEEECLTEMRKKSIDKPGPSGSGGQIDEKNIYSINPRLKAFSDWLLQEMISGNLEVIFPAASHAYAPVVEELWKDRALQATYNRRNEICMLPKVANYFLDRTMPSNDRVAEVMELSMQSNVTDEETQVPGPKRPGHVRTYGLSSSLTDVIGGGYRQSQEQTQIIQMQLQEQFNQYRVQLELQMKEMMGAMRTEMQDTIQSQQTVIQAQQTRVEHLEYQLQAMSGPVAPAATPLDSLHNRHVPRASSIHRTATWSEPVPHSQQQSHASTSSFSRHLSSQEIQLSKRRKKKKKK